MLLLVAPTDAACIHLVAADACMCPPVVGTVVSAEVVVTPDMHFSHSIGEATAFFVSVVAIVVDYVAGAAIIAVPVAAVVVGAVAVGVATLTSLAAAAPSTALVCPAQTCPSPSVLSLSTYVLSLFHQAKFCAAHACMHLRTCGPHHV